VVLLLAGWLTASLIHAQTTFGTIRGTVRDAHDAVMVGINGALVALCHVLVARGYKLKA